MVIIITVFAVFATNDTQRHTLQFAQWFSLLSPLIKYSAGEFVSMNAERVTAFGFSSPVVLCVGVCRCVWKFETAKLYSISLDSFSGSAENDQNMADEMQPVSIKYTRVVANRYFVINLSRELLIFPLKFVFLVWWQRRWQQKKNKQELGECARVTLARFVSYSMRCRQRSFSFFFIYSIAYY